jgi:hypothetical protein
VSAVVIGIHPASRESGFVLDGVIVLVASVGFVFAKRPWKFGDLVRDLGRTPHE